MPRSNSFTRDVVRNDALDGDEVRCQSCHGTGTDARGGDCLTCQGYGTLLLG